MSNEYPAGYTPMADEELAEIYHAWISSSDGYAPYSYERYIERAVLARLPKPDHVPASPEVEARVDSAVEAGRINDKRDAERESLVRRIDEAIRCANAFRGLFRDIRAHLVGGEK